MTKLEEAARAAFKEAASKKHGFWYEGMEWDDLPDLQASFMDIARAAIEALREPTEAMLDAAVNCDRGPPRRRTVGACILAEHRAMIDAILSEGE